MAALGWGRSAFPAALHSGQRLWSTSHVRLAGQQELQAQVHQAIREMNNAAFSSRVCQRCQGASTTTCSFCPSCRLRLCDKCNPLGELPIIYIQKCVPCEEAGGRDRHIISSTEHRAQRRALIAVLHHMEHEDMRPSSRTGARRGIADFEKYAAHVGEESLPADELSILCYMAYSVTVRPPDVLDSSTVANYINALRIWHDLMKAATGLPLVNPLRSKRVRRIRRHLEKNFKKEAKRKQPWTLQQARRMYTHGFPDTRAGRHQKLCFLMCNLGLLRKNASRRLRIIYRVRDDGTIHYDPRSSVRVMRPPPPQEPFIHVKVKGDKNVTSAKQGDRYIPSYVAALDVLPVELLETYLIRDRPPSGGYLLVAPLGHAQWRDTPYGNHGPAFKKGYLRAHPEATDADKFGSGSARKALAQWMWGDGWAKRVIADAGGWFSRKSAVDLYFKTEPHRILSAIANLGTDPHLRQNRR